MNPALLDRIEERDAHVVVVGQGYVGLPVAMRSVEAGFRVTGYELDPTRLAALRAGRSYVEDVPSERIAAALRAGYVATDQVEDLAGFDIAVISVPTPLRDGAPDLSFVESAAATLARALSPGALVVLESTTYPGTTEELLRPLARGVGAARRRRLLPRLLARADRPRQPDVDASRTRRRSSPGSTPTRCAGSRRSTARSSRRSSRWDRRPRPSWSSCWRTRSAT